jgi:hypothetical protein
MWYAYELAIPQKGSTRFIKWNAGRKAVQYAASRIQKGDRVCIAYNLNTKSVVILMQHISIPTSASPYILHVALCYGPIFICIRSGLMWVSWSLDRPSIAFLCKMLDICNELKHLNWYAVFRYVTPFSNRRCGVACRWVCHNSQRQAGLWLSSRVSIRWQ